MNRILIALIVLMGGCGDNTISVESACGAQARAYCLAIGYPDSGCEAVYTVSVCHTDGDTVYESAQRVCMAAIADVTSYCGALGCTIPAACITMW